MLHSCVLPGSLSSIVNAMLGEPIPVTPGWSVEVIAILKYSDSSVVLSCIGVEQVLVL